ncbi:MAG: NUDIX hydrolase [Magnetococcales bacterium]|nr:NUDIX hydrolase [Magnetococcales bacterium]
MDKEAVIAQLNGLFQHTLGEARLLAITNQVPPLQQDARQPAYLPAPAEWPDPPLNDLHAIIPDWHYPCPQLCYQEIDYKGILWLRRQRQLGHQQPDQRGGPLLLSAATLPYCVESEALLLQHRSPRSATFPDSLHIIGGSLSPRQQERPLDRSLRDTALRESREETGLTLALPENSTVFLAIEYKTGCFQAVFVPQPVTAHALTTRHTTWEGELLCIPFRQLDRLLLDTWHSFGYRLVPSCLLHLLAWLASGGPGPSIRLGSQGVSAHALYQTVMDALQQQAAEQPEIFAAQFATTAVAPVLI